MLSVFHENCARDKPYCNLMSKTVLLLRANTFMPFELISPRCLYFACRRVPQSKLDRRLKHSIFASYVIIPQLQVIASFTIHFLLSRLRFRLLCGLRVLLLLLLPFSLAIISQNLTRFLFLLLEQDCRILLIHPPWVFPQLIHRVFS